VGSSLTSTWSQVSGPGTVTFSQPNSAITTAGFSAPGSYVLRLTASDSQLSSESSLTVTVNSANQPPAVNAGPDQAVTLLNPVSLNGTVTDDGFPTGSTLSVTWSKVSGPGIVTFSHPNLVTATATFSAPGSYVLRLTASDSQLTSSDDLVITVETCPVPSGLVAWWPGEGSFNDFIGTNHGTPSGGTTFVSGSVAQGFSLNGVDGAITVPDTPAIKPASISLEAWVKFDSLDSVTADAGLQYLVFKRGSGPFDAYSLFKLRRDGADRFHFLIGSDPTLNQRLAAISTTVITAGQYYHVVGTYDGINASIYINGVLETTQPVNYAIGYAAANKPLVIGSSGESPVQGHD
jgi:Concanavalin A-like lectin/glucanases superfamily